MAKSLICKILKRKVWRICIQIHCLKLFDTADDKIVLFNEFYVDLYIHQTTTRSPTSYQNTEKSFCSLFLEMAFAS